MSVQYEFLDVKYSSEALTSFLRASRDVRRPRMELRPTSLASCASWDEYCSRSFSVLTASLMVSSGDWD